MIEFPAKRLSRVRKMIREGRFQGDAAFEPVHRTLADSFKVDAAQWRIARLIGAIGFLLQVRARGLRVDPPEGRASGREARLQRRRATQ